MRIIVIGAGIGGLAAALALGRSGFEVQVFEQASELREVGAGIQISPNATRILHRLGLEEPLRRFAVRPRERVIRRWDDGRVIAREPLADVCERNFGAPYYHFHRAELLGQYGFGRASALKSSVACHSPFCTRATATQMPSSCSKRSDAFRVSKRVDGVGEVVVMEVCL
jgi:choline dehydrogenase-like flavoprotein